MPQVTYYVAASLDGFIADDRGGIGFLDAVADQGEDFGYEEFYGTVDGLVMGRATYDQVLSFGKWPYAGKPCWVCTSRKAFQVDVKVAASPDQVMREAIDLRHLRHLWLVGGGQLAAAFLERGAVDRLILSTIPVSLGKGIPLFRSLPPDVHLDRLAERVYDTGLLQQAFAVNRKFQSSG